MGMPRFASSTLPAQPDINIFLYKKPVVCSFSLTRVYAQ